MGVLVMACEQLTDSDMDSMNTCVQLDDWLLTL